MQPKSDVMRSKARLLKSDSELADRYGGCSPMVSWGGRRTQRIALERDRSSRNSIPANAFGGGVAGGAKGPGERLRSPPRPKFARARNLRYADLFGRSLDIANRYALRARFFRQPLPAGGRVHLILCANHRTNARSPFGSSAVRVAVGTPRLSCREVRKAQKFTSVRGPSGESRSICPRMEDRYV
jgi:hypothetical protein